MTVQLEKQRRMARLVDSPAGIAHWCHCSVIGVIDVIGVIGVIDVIVLSLSLFVTVRFMVGLSWLVSLLLSSLQAIMFSEQKHPQVEARPLFSLQIFLYLSGGVLPVHSQKFY